tara:strand:- start:1172 stop:1459 length:288 start_codon:yes stop_codon:yes gene_type:complete
LVWAFLNEIRVSFELNWGLEQIRLFFLFSNKAPRIPALTGTPCAKPSWNITDVTPSQAKTSAKNKTLLSPLCFRMECFAISSQQIHHCNRMHDNS